MTAETERPLRQLAVVEVLVAIGKAGLHHLIPADDGRLLGTHVARVEAGVVPDLDDQRAAARLIAAHADRIGPPLAHLGIAIPDVPTPVTRTGTSHTESTLECKLWMLASGRIGIISPFALNDTISALPGAIWDKFVKASQQGRRGAWTIPGTPAAAAAALDTLAATGYRARPSVLELADRHAAALDARSLLADGGPVPDNDGTDVMAMPLWTHQRRGVAFAEVSQAFLIAVKMGGGKTGMAIAAANRVGARTVLIVAPNKVRRVWPREVRERSAVRWHISDGTRDPARRGAKRQDLGQPERVALMDRLFWDCDCGAPIHAFVINYEALDQPVWQKWAPPKGQKIDLIIYDEAHNLKNPTLRGKAPKAPLGPAEAALPVFANDEQIREARRQDKIGPRERALGDNPVRAALLVARAADKLERRQAEDARAGRLTRSGIAHRWVGWSHRRIGLTGTPFPQHPWDIFGILRAIDPGILGWQWDAFADKYVKMDKSGTFPVKIKPHMIAEFAEKCMTLMYRPKVDLRLPGCVDILREIELEPAARRAYDEMDERLTVDLTRWVAEARAGGVIEVDGELVDYDLIEEYDGPGAELHAANILSRLLRLQQLTGGTLRADPVKEPGGRVVAGPEARVSTAKAEALATELQRIGCDGSIAEADREPVCVFTRFTSDLDAVRAVAEAAGLRYGEISGRRSDGLDDDARMAPGIDVCGVNIQAGGTGIDLTRSCYGIWYSLGYSVSGYDQARARQYRPGQRRAVTYVHLVAVETKDQAVYTAIKARKAAVAAVLLAGGVDPAEVGLHESDPGPDPNAAASEEIDGSDGAVPLPWEDH